MLELLGGKLTSSMEVHRVAFTEVTKKAVLAAIDNPRQVWAMPVAVRCIGHTGRWADAGPQLSLLRVATPHNPAVAALQISQELVDAYLARRALDYLVRHSADGQRRVSKRCSALTIAGPESL